MSMDRYGGMKLTGKTIEVGVKPVPAPLRPPQIPHELTRARGRPRCERPATNCLSHGHVLLILTANPIFSLRLILNAYFSVLFNQLH
jgi:hypothetical protein